LRKVESVLEALPLKKREGRAVAMAQNGSLL
jgi:hypothetical protein